MSARRFGDSEFCFKKWVQMGSSQPENQTSDATLPEKPIFQLGFKINWLANPKN